MCVFRSFTVIAFVLVGWLALSGFYKPSHIDNNNPNIRLIYPHQTAGLPIVNYFEGKPGCYLSCYSNQEGVYKVGKFGIHGLIRVAGSYPVSVPSERKDDRQCSPVGQASDVRSVPKYVNLCNKHFDSCQGKCLPGRDTGSFYFR